MFKYVTTIANRSAQPHKNAAIQWASSSGTGKTSEIIPKGITTSSKREIRNQNLINKYTTLKCNRAPIMKAGKTVHF